MPIDNYVNPTSLAPSQGGWQPQGALSGMAYADRTQDYERNLALSELVQNMAAQNTAGVNQAAAQVRPSATLAEIAKNQATQQTAVPKALAELESTRTQTKATDLSNRFNEGTLDSRIKETLSANLEKQGERGVQQLDRTMQLAATLAHMAASSSGNPIVNKDGTVDNADGSNFAISKSMAANLAKQFGLNPNDPAVNMMINSPASAKKWAEIIDSVNTQYRQKLGGEAAKQDAEYKKAVKVAEIEAESRVKAAGVASEASGYEAKALLGAYTKDIQRRNPDMGAEEVGKLAADKYMESKYGALGGKLEPTGPAGDRSLNAALDKKIAEDTSLASKLPDGPFKKQIMDGVAKVTNAADYEKVKPGDSYMSPDGKLRTKPKAN